MELLAIVCMINTKQNRVTTI